MNGGAVYDGTLIGKSIRYYHASDSLESFFYSDSKPTTAGHLVPCTLGTVPCMTLPDKLPDNIDYEHYIQSAYDALQELGIKVDKEIKINKADKLYKNYGLVWEYL